MEVSLPFLLGRMDWKFSGSVLALAAVIYSAKGEFVITPLLVEHSHPSWLPANWEPDVVGNTYSIVNNRGEVAFFLRRSNSVGAEVALVGGPCDNPKIIAATGELAPGLSGVTFGGFGNPSLNRQGDILFYASLTGDGVELGPEPPGNQHSIWLCRDGSVELVMRSGVMVPGIGTFTFSNADYLLGVDECALLLRRLANPGANEPWAGGLWRWRSGSLASIVETGALLPDGTTLSNLFQGFPLHPVIAGQGMVAFGRTGEGKETLWWFGEQNRHRLMTQGETIDWGGGGQAIADGYFQTGGRPYFCANDSGEVAFNAWTSLGPAVVRSKEGQSVLIALWGADAPGTSGASFGSSVGDPIMIPCINDAGQVGLYASLSGPGVAQTNNLGIWVTRNGVLNLVVRTGSQAPGRLAGVLFAGLDGSQFINSAGQMVFGATLSGPGVNESNDRGIWFADADGALEPIVMEGDGVEIGNGEIRVITGFGTGPFHSVYSPNGDDGKGTPFNDRGEFVFYAEWVQPEAGAGYFVASQFRIHEIVVSNQDIRITFPSRAGRSYRVGTSQGLIDADWLPAPGSTQGRRWTTTVTFPEPSDTSFYLIEEVP